MQKITQRDLEDLEAVFAGDPPLDDNKRRRTNFLPDDFGDPRYAELVEEFVDDVKGDVVFNELAAKAGASVGVERASVGVERPPQVRQPYKPRVAPQPIRLEDIDDHSLYLLINKFTKNIQDGFAVKGNRDQLARYVEERTKRESNRKYDPLKTRTAEYISVFDITKDIERLTRMTNRTYGYAPHPDDLTKLEELRNWLPLKIAEEKKKREDSEKGKFTYWLKQQKKRTPGWERKPNWVEEKRAEYGRGKPNGGCGKKTKRTRRSRRKRRRTKCHN